MTYSYRDPNGNDLGSTAPTIAGVGYSVQAHFAGSANYSAADSAWTSFSIAQATPTVTLSAASAPAGGTITVTATVSPTLVNFMGYVA